jgi:hypothetical protein
LNFTTFWRPEKAVLVSIMLDEVKFDSAKLPLTAVLNPRVLPHPDLSITDPVAKSLKS